MLAAAGSQSLLALAQDTGTARFILGSPPGSALDVLCRMMAEGIQPGYARNAIVETRGGASGQIAVSAVKSAPADGMTILATPMPHMGIFPFSYRKLPYDPIADFTAVGMGTRFDLAFVVGPAVPASVKTLADFVAWVKANPGRGSFGSPAAGSTPHFVGAAGRAAGIELTHIPYRGPTPAVTDMAVGRLPPRARRSVTSWPSCRPAAAACWPPPGSSAAATRPTRRPSPSRASRTSCWTTGSASSFR